MNNEKKKQPSIKKPLKKKPSISKNKPSLVLSDELSAIQKKAIDNKILDSLIKKLPEKKFTMDWAYDYTSPLGYAAPLAKCECPSCMKNQDLSVEEEDIIESLSKKDLIGVIYNLLEESGKTSVSMQNGSESFFRKDLIVDRYEDRALPYIAFRSLIRRQEEDQ